MSAVARRIWVIALLGFFAVAATVGGCGTETMGPPIMPSQATLTAQSLFADALVNEALVYGDYLVITTGVDEQIEPALSETVSLDSAIQILDKTSLEIVGRLPIETDPMDMVAIGKTLYVASGDALAIVDLTVPKAPVLVSSIPTRGYARTVVHTGGLLVVGEGIGTLEDPSQSTATPQLWVLDVSGDPYKPVDIGYITAEGPISDLATDETGWVYTAEWDAGVGAYDVVAFADAGKEAVRRYPTNDGRVDGVAVEGDRLYAALNGGAYMHQNGEIRVFDANGPHTKAIASQGIDVWVRTVIPRPDGRVLFVGVDPTGSQIGAAAPGWDLEPVILADYRDNSWQFALDLAEDGDVIHALVAQPTGRLDFGGSGGCAIQVDNLDTSLRAFRIDD